MDKLEKHIKQSLEQRKLSPSKDAWDKIESQLGNSGSKTRLAAKWYAVAAVFLLFVWFMVNSGCDVVTGVAVGFHSCCC